MDQVSSLRQDRGVTVRTLATIRALRATEAKAAHDQPRFPAGDGQEKRSTSCQLRGSLTHPSVDAKVSLRASNRLCRRFQLSPLIRGGLTTAPRLAGPSHPSPPRPGVLWALFLATLALLVLQTTASANKLPLVRTRVTSQRTFRGSKTSAAMPSSKAMILPRGAMFQTAPRTQELTQEPLDFQTMKVIENWGDQFIDVLLVSGRNYVYMINASSTGSGEISYIRKLRWKSHDNIRKSCIQMRNEPSNCNNYIRIVEILDNGKLYICGTNAYNPKCRLYLRHQLESGPGPDSSLADDTPFVGERSCEDTCGCPRIPTTSSAHLYTNTSAGYLLFSGVTPDYLGKKSFLMRSVDYLQSVEGVLNTPTFIKLIEYEDKVYLFFRETASRVETGTDSLRFYARVAQVCKDDMGGNTILENKWTTFIKARLECSIPGSHYTEGFTFNNLTSVSDITQVQMADGSSMDVVFATFTTPWGLDGVSMSSVCMFSMRESIQTLFDTGSFLGKAEFESKPDSNNGYSGRSETTKAVPIPDDFTPSPRPGSCHRQKSDEELAFIKKYPLMYSSVKPIYNQPIFTSESDIRVTQIALDNNAGYHNKKVLYLGTEKGSILRVRTRFEYTEGPKAILLEEMAVSDSDKCTNLACTVRSLHVTRPAVGKPKARKSTPGGPNVFVAFTDRITLVPVAVCISYGKEDCCNADPDCGWGRQGCQQRNASNYNSLPAINNLASVPSKCEVPPTPPVINCPKTPRCADVAKRDANHSDVTQSTTPRAGCAPKSPGRKRPQVDRRATPRKDRTQKDDPGASHSCQDASSREEKTAVMQSDEMLMGLFRERILPLVSSSFHETLHSLPEQFSERQRHNLMYQLQEALAMTTNLVLRNHRQESYLGTCTVSSLTHAYPLLMREVALWHEKALESMVADDMMNACWTRSTSSGSPCVGTVSISIPLAPTLWEPLKNLMSRDFDAICDVIPGASAQASNCSHLGAVASCKDGRFSNSASCQPKECQFVGLPMDVMAFFRHVNDCQKFLKPGVQPLWKDVNVTLSPVNAIRGHLELYLSRDHPFLIRYSPVPEKVKISFHYKAVRDCDLNNALCNGKRKGCNPDLEDTMNTWFTKVVGSLKYKKPKKCSRQLAKYKQQLQQSDSQRSQMTGQTSRIRNRGQVSRSASRSRRQAYDARGRRQTFRRPNQVHPSMPKKCRYIKKSAPRLKSRLWPDLVLRAQNRGGEYRGGEYSDLPQRINFYSLEHLRDFFDNRCSVAPPHPSFATFGKAVRRKKIKSEVRVFVSRDMPFVIERIPTRNRITFKYFTHNV